MYTDLFDGLRGWYAQYPSRRSAAGFHAATAMTVLACITLSASTVLLDYFVHGDFVWTMTVFQNRLLVLGAAGIIWLLHIQLGKRTGRYESKDLHTPPHWKLYVAAYICVAWGLTVTAAVIAIVSR